MRLLNRFAPRRAATMPARVIADGLTYLSPAALDDLQRAVVSIEQRRLPGMLIEAGCALGGSALVMADAKSPDRPFHVYDVFGMIPPPGEKDGPDVQRRFDEIRSGQSKGINGGTYYGYQPDLLQTVTETFHRYGVDPARRQVRFVRGLFQDTLRLDGPVALAHIDGDWYDSVSCCLSRIEPWLVPGGMLIIDDYQAWSGCRRAVDEYFASGDRKDRFEWSMRARLHLIPK
jgi:asparagine synthase (glutamine-hydrolysing)